MEQRILLFISTVLVFLSPGVRGTFHLTFDTSGQVNISRSGCGVSKVCVETPSGCEPAGSGACLFTSVSSGASSPPNGTELSVELSGNSTGFVAMGLTANASQGTTLFFACAQNNGSIFFRTLSRNNTDNTVSAVETITTGIRLSLNGSLIQCEFTVPGVNASSTRSSDATTFAVVLATGTTNGTTLGPLEVALTSDPVNVANPSNASATMAPTTTTAGADSSFKPRAVLLLLSFVTLSVLKSA